MGGFLCIAKKDHFNPYRKAIIVNKDENFEGILGHKDPAQNIICKCEQVTEAEIIDALQRPIPIKSLDAIKRRTRTGMGLCQGHFCGPKVKAIISRETGLSEEEITPRGKGSSILPPRAERSFFIRLNAKP
ncbi:(2Fe-2S)-binding protein [Geosporobacter ferrireducens]|uniref:BFD-like [2Fe-2S]-binding domain-containing protein n=1 Tax=Geosporobacter ferrireducens TaxID=1424294 RepID=A0A1D8GJL7_9FIRM|nr:(2Fe-2S)-binding protein [Geosporobacter ferrireducens]AOT71106.1 hypothetical protein Gferi_17040 [Geosporobacter ferrireducens]MTI57911.1 hypothetical protein [Geosporobacter ferrireducens]